MLVASIFDIECTADHNWRVVLGEIVGVSDAAALHNAFLEIANATGDVTVDCRATESIDASIFQLLIAL
ncbi:MAG TPA: STAS domain-containing protein [Pirellulaceae bacterium]|nr:STAS domain-containing protein [Pirellulaceae bacterium]